MTNTFDPYKDQYLRVKTITKIFPNSYFVFQVHSQKTQNYICDDHQSVVLKDEEIFQHHKKKSLLVGD